MEPLPGYDLSLTRRDRDEEDTCCGCGQDKHACVCYDRPEEEDEEDLPEFKAEPAPQVRRLVGLMVMGAR